MGGIGQIPATKILQYLQWVGMKNIKESLEIINRVDVAYVNAINDAQQNKSKVVKGKNG